ncbi:MAG: hypothetical protein IT473_06565 [Lysobacter sp.]|nr:hypothetical protein [Lysobacter sp.]
MTGKLRPSVQREASAPGHADAVRHDGEPAPFWRTTPPRLRKDFILRPRLGLPFGIWSEMPVVAIEAPAGCGKTVLLSQWRKAAGLQGAAVGWLSLHASDGAADLLEGFATAIATATGRQKIDIDAGACATRDGRRRLAEALLNEWLSFARALYLVLDNLDQPSAVETTDLIRLIISNVPPNGRVFLGTRSTVPFAWLAELQAYGQAAVLKQQDVVFTVEETDAYLTRRLPIKIRFETGAQVHDHTRGWPMGLELFCAALQKTGHAERNLAAMTAEARPVADAVIEQASRQVGEYLIEAAVDRLGAEMRDFLLDVGHLRRLHPGLCEAVAGPEGARLLERLRTSAPLLVEDRDAGWCELHRLVHDRLKLDIARLPLPRRIQLDSRAAVWLLDHAEFEDAVAHALAAGLSDLAFTAIEKCVVSLIALGRFDVIDGWLARLDRGEIANREMLRVPFALREAIGGPKVEGRVEEFSGSSERNARFAVAFVRALRANHADDPDEAARALAEWWDGPCYDEPAIRMGYANVKAWLQSLGFRSQGNAPHAVPTLQIGGPAFIESATYHLAAVIQLQDGQPLLAADLLMPALRYFESSEGRRSVPACLAAFTLAVAAVEGEDYELARHLLADRMDLLDRAPMPDELAFGFIAAAALAEHDGQPSRALDLLERLQSLSRKSGLIRIEAMATAELIRLHAKAGRLEICEQLAMDLRGRVDTLVPSQSLNGPRAHAILSLLEGRVAWSRRRPVETRKRCEDAIVFARSGRFRRLELEACLLRAAAIHDLTGEVAPDLHDVASLARTLGLRRLLRHACDTLQPRLLRAITVGSDQDRLASETPPPAPSPQGGVEHPDPTILTLREIDVLALLARGFTNKEIARRLDIGDGTVKWHLKNLFSKLAATDRRQLAARAQLMGLVAE